MEIATPNNVSDYLISFAHSTGDVITNLKLQKLLFYSQAWYLALKDDYIFEEDFQAWVHGPVLVSQYQRFRHYSYHPISEDITEPDIPQELINHLNEIMDVFGGEGAYTLERLVHQESPWIESRDNLDQTEPSTNIISKEKMKTFYKQMAEMQNAEDSAF